MIKWKLSLILLFTSQLGNSQEIPLETWRTHFSYNNINILAQSNSGIFGAADHGIIQVSGDNSLSKITKANGLSGASITCLGANKNHQFVMVGHENGAIDIITSDNTINIKDLRDSDLVGSKKINDVTSTEQTAYFATDFGIIVVDLNVGTIKENYRSIGINGSNPAVLEIELVGSELYVITAQGIQKGNISNNLLDFTQWDFFPNLEESSYSHLQLTTQSLFVVQNDSTIAQLENSNWKTVITRNNPIISTAQDENKLLFLIDEKVYSYQAENIDLFLDVSDFDVNTIHFDEGLWLGDSEKGIINPSNQSIIINGPVSDNLKKVKVTDEDIFAFYSQEPNELASHNGYETFSGMGWSYEEIDGFNRISDIAIYNDHLILASLDDGLYNLNTKENLTVEEPQFLPSNSNSKFEVTSILVYRSTLWASSYDNNLPLLSYDGDTWNSYSDIDLGTSFPVSIKSSANGTIWINTDRQEGLKTFNVENESLTLNIGDGLRSNNITDFDITDEDEVWIASSNGLDTYLAASSPSDNFEVITPIFNGFVLFDDTNVTNVETDGGNRVWASTDQGLWVFDASISSLIHQFNSTNSPLPSNNITDLAYNKQNGEIFILTDLGLVSYRSSSSEGRAVNTAVDIFPNPVHPNYDGLVAVKNVVNNAIIKITDINGKLIRQVDAVGGTAAWNLLDYSGNRAKTGVYLIFSLSQDGVESFVGKLAVID